MEALIPGINKLQEICSVSGGSVEIKLPQIVVLGSQSSGKSSVLESLVGKSFLPRGAGMVTRCPIVLQMTHFSKEAKLGIKAPQGVQEWCQFLHTDEIFTDFEQVREEIERETDRNAGKSKGVCMKEVCLKVYSPKVLNLTVVDLPGLVKVALPGQPMDIPQQIEQMVRKYIANENSIILAVSAGNNDIATSESLNLAKQVDPHGERTLAILTKLDLLDSGTTATDILSGKALPVKLGIIGVVNRGYKDMEMPIEDALIREADFFARNYPTMRFTNGTPYLAKRLNELLLKHIISCLPFLIKEVDELLLETEKELERLGNPVNEKKSVFMVQTLNEFANAYEESLYGKSRNIETGQLTGGAKISNILNERFSEELYEIDPSDEVTDNQILIAAGNARGMKSRSFVFEDVYHELAKLYISRLYAPVAHCAQQVHDEMKHKVAKAIPNAVHRFPKLKTAIQHAVNDMLKEKMEKGREQLNFLVDIQASDIRTATSNNEFNAMDNKTVSMLKAPAIPKPNDGQLRNLNKQQEFCAVTREALSAYFKANIIGSLLHTVPKALDLIVISPTVKDMLNNLVKVLNTEENVQRLIAEAPEITEKRIRTNEAHKVLLSAKDILNDIECAINVDEFLEFFHQNLTI